MRARSDPAPADALKPLVACSRKGIIAAEVLAVLVRDQTPEREVFERTERSASKERRRCRERRRYGGRHRRRGFRTAFATAQDKAKIHRAVLAASRSTVVRVRLEWAVQRQRTKRAVVSR
jgi:hypothetical protein